MENETQTMSLASENEAANTALGGGTPGWFSITPVIFLFAVIYFLILRPYKKQADAHEKLMVELKKGDRVVTNGGLIGTITKIEPAKREVEIEIAANVRVLAMKEMIIDVLKDKANEKEVK